MKNADLRLYQVPDNEPVGHLLMDSDSLHLAQKQDLRSFVDRELSSLDNHACHPV